MDSPTTAAAVPAIKSTTDTVLQVLSWVLNTVGVAVGIAGLIYAIIQGRKTKTAEALVKKVKRDLYHQKASQVFVQMSSTASSLTSNIRAKDWARATDSLISVGGDIANALGAFPELIGKKGTDALNLCAADLVAMFDALPLADQPDCDPEVIKSLLTASVTVDFRLQTIAGQMRLAIELENPNERDSDGNTTASSRSDGGREAREVDNGENRAEEVEVGTDADGV